jgi:hypothetical protein
MCFGIPEYLMFLIPVDIWCSLLVDDKRPPFWTLNLGILYIKMLTYVCRLYDPNCKNKGVIVMGLCSIAVSLTV